MGKQRFDLLRACFYLLACVVIVICIETMIALLSCIWMIAIEQREPVGACAETGNTIRDIMTEMLTAILALLAASRGPPPPSNDL